MVPPESQGHHLGVENCAVGKREWRAMSSRKNSAAALNPTSTAERLRKLTSLRPTLAVVLGSGFGHAVTRLRVEAEIPYVKLPGFPRPGIGGHSGKLFLGHFGGAPACVLSGRAHFYEGHSMEAVTFPIRVLAEFGVRDVLLTNAAGGINRQFRPGDLMRLTDHINLMGTNPLRGPLAPKRERFIDLTHAYDARLGRLVERAARKIEVRLRSGVYLAVCGPSYETPAEIRAFARLGADAVGMSTVPETIVARQCGLAVAGLSCITNLAAGRGNALLSHADVLAAGERVKARAAALIEQFAKLYAARD
jgi:purine-nucleoside phosphorylase